MRRMNNVDINKLFPIADVSETGRHRFNIRARKEDFFTQRVFGFWSAVPRG